MKQQVTKLLLISFFILCTAPISAQCYQRGLDMGTKFYNSKKYSKAIEAFTNAKKCPDAEAAEQKKLDEWIAKCRKMMNSQPNPGVPIHNNPPQEYVPPSTESYLYLNGKSDGQTISFDYTGGRKTFSVTTSSNEYYIKDLPSWCYVEEKTTSHFSIQCYENKSSTSRSGWFDVFSDGKYIRVTIKQSSGSYLKVEDREDEVSSVISGSGNSITYHVSTNFDYSIEYLPPWCSLQSKESDYFQIKISENLSDIARSDYFKVTAGGMSVKINIFQSATTRVNLLAKGEWRDKMKKTQENVTTSYDNNSSYKGMVTEYGARNGYGAYCWRTNHDYYWGEWNNNKRSGYGIYFITQDGYEISGLSNCVYYVGQFSDGQRSGQCSCYDEKGNLIYYGEIIYGKPTGQYPTTSGFEDHKFECIDYSDGACYVGETMSGKRSGKGIFIYPDGSCWYGTWSNGYGVGSGVFMPYSGECVSEDWPGDTRPY